MKRAFLTGLGLEKDVIDQIMAAHGTTVSELDTQIQNLTKERDDAKEALQAFDGIDVKALQAAESTLKAEYEGKILNMERTAEIRKALSSAKAKHPDLLMSQIDMEKITKDKDGKFTGIDEAVQGLQQTYADQFGQTVSGDPPANPEGNNNPTFDFGWVPPQK